MKRISPSRLRNFVSNNTLQDWLQLYGKKKGYKPNPLKRRRCGTSNIGIQFEKHVYQLIRARFPSWSCVNLSNQNYSMTLAQLKRGTEMLYQATLQNPDNKTHGIADFIIRSDLVSKIFTNYEYPESTVGCEFNPDWHYVVMDTKFINLDLCSDGARIRNTDSSRFYKLQLYIYSQALGFATGYQPKYGLVIGRGNKYTSKKTTYISNQSLDRPGIVEFQKWDKDIKKYLIDGSQWIHDLLNHGDKWEVVKTPTRSELYANCKAYHSYPWKTQIAKIATEQDELTQLINFGYKQRNQAHDNNLFTISALGEDAPTVEKNLELIGFNPTTKTGETLTKIIIQQNNPDSKLEIPSRIKTKLQGYSSWLYIDFEEWSTAEIDFSQAQTTINGYVYLVGVWHNNHYTNFSMKNSQRGQQQKLLCDLLDYLEKYPDQKIVHWGDYEVRKIKEFAKTYPVLNDRISKVLPRMIDLSKIFSNNLIIVPGMFNFSLKSVAKSVFGTDRYSGLGCTDGLESEFIISNIAATNPEDWTVADQYEKLIMYNRLDCEIMHDIIQNILDEF